MTEIRKAVVLLSGGLDSATCLAIARHEGFEAHALVIDYRQRHAVELEASARVAEALEAASLRRISIDLRSFGHSALTGDEEVPKSDDHRGDESIPITYVPARNTIFLSYALAYGEVLGTGDIFIGVNALDYSGYPDCRPEYIEAFERMANLATKGAIEGTAPVKIHMPLVHLTKASIILRGTKLGVDYGLTWSCYDPTPEGSACGRCPSCHLRKRGFAEAGVADPTVYAT